MISRKTDTLVILVIIAATLSSCSQNSSPPPLRLDDNLTFQLIQNGSALEKKSLVDFQGNWLLVNFWSVGCPPCFEEIPDLAKAHTLLDKPPLTVIGVAMSYDRPDSVLETTKRINIPYPVSFDLDRKIEKAFGEITVIPSSFLLGPTGLPVKKYTGKVTFRQIEQDLRQFSKTYQQKD